jgi:hypothetical protein
MVAVSGGDELRERERETVCAYVKRNENRGLQSFKEIYWGKFALTIVCLDFWGRAHILDSIQTEFPNSIKTPLFTQPNNNTAGDT